MRKLRAIWEILCGNGVIYRCHISCDNVQPTALFKSHGVHVNPITPGAWVRITESTFEGSRE